MKRLVVAKSAGFCFGVKRAIELAEKCGRERENVSTLGPIIHNEDAVQKLKSEGVGIISDPSEAKAGDTVIIRSHGAADSVYEALRERGAEIADATCPMVARVHDIVKRELEEGRTIIILGDREHPEIQAITEGRGGILVFRGAEDADKYFADCRKLPENGVSIVSQTTAEQKNLKNLADFIKKLCTNVKLFDTICSATSERQREAAALGRECGAVVVVGGKNSNNSRNLALIAGEGGAEVFFIENAGELEPDKLRNFDVVGITAGASTPEWIIKEVVNKMSDEIKEKIEEMTEKVAEAKEEAAKAVAEVKEKVEEKINEAELSFQELLERSIKTLHTGEKVSGVVSSIGQTEISVDLGTKQSGYIPVDELTDEPGVNVNDIVKVGDEIEAYVMRVNDVEGTVMLSKKRLDSAKNWENIVSARNEGTVVEGTVIEENKGGVVVLVKGVRVFVPASQSGLPKDAPMTELLKKKVKLRIREVNQPRRRVVGSIRDVAYAERRAKAQEVWDNIEVGKHYNGVVKSLTSYGAFVDIGGVDGMVHVSELSWGRVRQPSDVVKVGDELDVYVINFDKDAKKISLGHKDPNGNPWKVFTDKYSVGDVADVKIVKLMTFGAFAEIVPGVDGLIHISQIADRRIGKPEDVLSEGQEVKAKITAIDEENKKVSLSIRALLEPEAPAVEAEAAEDDEPAVVYDTENPPAEVEE